MKKVVLLCMISIVSMNCYSQTAALNLSKGKDLSAKEDYNSAIYYFNLVIHEDSNYYEAFSERAHAFNMIGDYKKSLQDYNYVLTKLPGCAICYFGLATIYDTWFNDKSRAIENYTIAINLSIENKDYDYAGISYFMRANLKLKLGDKKGYLNDLIKGTELNSNECKLFLELEKTEDKF